LEEEVELKALAVQSGIVLTALRQGKPGFEPEEQESVKSTQF